MDTFINFTSFTSLMKDRIQRQLGEEYHVYEKTVSKNNGIMRNGLIAQKYDCNASPAIYISEYYREGMTVSDIYSIADDLVEEFRTPELGHAIDLSNFMDFSKASGRVVYKLIHRGKNVSLLRDIPHRDFLDLSIVYYYTVDEAPFHGKATILISNQHIKKWKTNEEQLFQLACQNSPRLLPWKLEGMESVLQELIHDNSMTDIEDFVKEASSNLPMYVLSNKSKLWGAACILYPEVLKCCAMELGDSFMVLPSSVHEVILMPEKSSNSCAALREIVREINSTQVAPDEVLSNSVYYYDKEAERLICTH